MITQLVLGPLMFCMVVPGGRERRVKRGILKHTFQRLVHVILEPAGQKEKFIFTVIINFFLFYFKFTECLSQQEIESKHFSGTTAFWDKKETLWREGVCSTGPNPEHQNHTNK